MGFLFEMTYLDGNITGTDTYYGEAPSSVYDEANTTYPTGADEYGYGYGDEYASESTYGGYDKKKEDADLWYGALSVAVLTLGLILIVEEVRHRLDHAAIGKPFVLSVLDGVYRELATLGVVELGVHLLQTYTDGIDKNRKAVFADVHFLLFYTAICNAFQALILAFCSNRVSDRLWVQTEELELDHYVEIREEFDRVREELYGDNSPPPNTNKLVKGFSRGYNNFSRSVRLSNRDTISSEDEGKVDCIKKFLLGALYTIIYPQQKSNYNGLLLQVRFHELRVHFLQSYQLPLKMKVSDYLVKSQLHVLEHFVHISHSTWLILTAVCNVLYFFMGISAEVSGIAETSGYALSIIFFGAMVGFVVLSVAIYFHMESVFKKLMKMNHLWTINEGEDPTGRNEDLAAEQNKLFVFGDPHIILKGIKFMQFGYAVAISLIVVYWDDMEKDDDFNALAYTFATCICYAVFVAVMARVLPLLVTVTSMGQLVDKERLHEVRAAFNLREAERRRHADMSVVRHREHGFDKDETNRSISTSLLTGSSPNDLTISEEFAAVPTAIPKFPDGSETSPSKDSPKVDRREVLASLVKLDTESLRTLVLPTEGHPDRDHSRRHSRRRSLSDNVSAMRLLSDSSSMRFSSNSAEVGNKEFIGVTNATTDTLSQWTVTFDDLALPDKSKRPREHRDRRRTQSANASIQAMRDAKDPGEAVMATDREAKTASTRRPSAPTGLPSILLADILSVVPEQGKSQSGGPLDERSTKAGKMMEEEDVSISELSDVEDTPVLDSPNEMFSYANQTHESVPSIPWSQRIAKFFESSTYKFGTHICGTMVAFFFVGMRVEGFLKQQCIIPEEDHSWELSLHDSFRLLVAWIAGFMATSLANVLVSPAQERGSLFIASTMDIILCSMCLLFMLEAENKRCCEDAFTPEAHYSETDNAGFRLSQEECVDSTLECTCLDFGHRSHGGLGSIEPYTALIGLRVFRFWLSKRIVAHFGLEEQKSYATHSHGNTHHGHGDITQKGTAVELWHAAMVRFPDLVEKHGEFSGEVLQAMLGIEIIESRPELYKALEAAPEQTGTPNVSVPIVPQPEIDNVVVIKEKYSGLEPQVQEIIAAGKMGLPVKPCLKKKAKLSSRTIRTSAPMAPLEFEYDEKTDAVEHLIDSAVSYPNARVVRSMRRCERKLLPLLNKWTSVDVVITNHEMVYVDLHDDHDDEISEGDIRKRLAAKEAVIATDGGKGLRLCDVVAGRRIVGHLSFSDVTAVHVEREVPSILSATFPKNVPGQNEYWQSCEDTIALGGADSMQKRWEQVNQDRLRIMTMHGTLFLRFHSDLHDGEMHSERILEEVGDESPLHKDIAFQWAQTIVRHCGVSQLQQDLSHFGHDDGDELRDYLEIVHKESKPRHHRHASIGTLMGSLPRPLAATFTRQTSNLTAESQTRYPTPNQSPEPSDTASVSGMTIKKDKAGNLTFDV